MTVWAIVPIKPLNRAKSRLAPVLTTEQRERLALGMLLHNLKVLTATPVIKGVLVISRDMKALASAREILGVQTLQESGTPELNNALRRAARMLLSWGASATLILPADVPLVAQTDIEQMVHMGRFRNTLVIAPDQVKDGSNAIFSRPPNLIDFAFGVGSYERHIKAAQLVGAEVHTYESDRLALDVDTAEDLRNYYALAEQLGEKPVEYFEIPLPQ